MKFSDDRGMLGISPFDDEVVNDDVSSDCGAVVELILQPPRVMLKSELGELLITVSYPASL